MLTPEGRIKAAITALLKAYKRDHELWYYMPVPSGYGSTALDYLGVVYGKPFAVEAKRPRGKPTPRQWLTIKALQRAGAAVFLVDGPESLKELSAWLEEVTNVYNI